jgi:hypothetical protein
MSEEDAISSKPLTSSDTSLSSGGPPTDTALRWGHFRVKPAKPLDRNTELPTSKFPRDVFHCMLSYCRLSELCQCMRVCVSWRQACSKVIFYRMNTFHQYIGKALDARAVGNIRTLSMNGTFRTFVRTTSSACLNANTKELILGLFESGEASRAFVGAVKAYDTCIQLLLSHAGLQAAGTTAHAAATFAARGAIKELEKITHFFSMFEHLEVFHHKIREENGVKSTVTAEFEERVSTYKWRALASSCMLYLCLKEDKMAFETASKLLKISDMPRFAWCYSMLLKAVATFHLMKHSAAHRDVQACIAGLLEVQQQKEDSNCTRILDLAVMFGNVFFQAHLDGSLEYSQKFWTETMRGWARSLELQQDWQARLKSFDAQLERRLRSRVF